MVYSGFKYCYVFYSVKLYCDVVSVDEGIVKNFWVNIKFYR